jgi:DNA repair exonuclease SbcCD nuclease subunit
MKVEKAKFFLRSLRRCTDDELKSVAEAMQSAGETFGHPHLHTGVDIRRLGKNLFECRTGIHLRLLFKSGPDVITFVFAGNHDDVQAHLKNMR